MDVILLIISFYIEKLGNFIAVLCRSVDANFKLTESLIGFKIANNDKTASGIYEDIKQFIAPNKFPLPIISDNCAVMRAMEKLSDDFVKIYCIEHKLAIFENTIHKNKLFSDVDAQITQINSYFNYRHAKFDLPRKPLRYSSSTRPWRSHLSNYTIFIANYDRYCEISIDDQNFPQLPAKDLVCRLLKFEEKFVKNFSQLEEVTSDLNTGLVVYFNLLELFRQPDWLCLELESMLIADLYPFIFSKISNMFYILNKTNISGILSDIFNKTQVYNFKHLLNINFQMMLV